jgi:hypothetical protein
MGNTPSGYSVGGYYIDTAHQEDLKIFVIKEGRLISERKVTGGGSYGNKLRFVYNRVKEVRNLR